MSKTIDERVVEMRFDNSRFEKNVQDTIDQLEQLKKSLKFEETADGLDGFTSKLGKLKSKVTSGFKGIFNGFTSAINNFKSKLTSGSSGIFSGFTSMLDNLKNKLNFGKNSGLQNLASEAGQTTAAISNIGNALEGVKVKFSALQIIGATVLSNLTNKAIGFVGNLVSGAINQIKTGGWKRASDLEQARFSLEGILKDGPKVKEVLKNAADSVDGTAYALNSAAIAASQFAASGIQAGTQMEKALSGVAGIAATTNSDYDSIAHIFTTVAGNGKLMTMQLNQLSLRGMNAAASLTDYFNKVNKGSVEATDSVKKAVKSITKGKQITEGELRDLVTKGKISFEIFSEAMATTFGDQAGKANETFTGAMANIRAALSRTGQMFFTSYGQLDREGEEFKGIVDAGSAVVEMFNSIRLMVNRLNKDFNDSKIGVEFQKDVEKAANAVTKLMNAIDIGTYDANGKLQETIGTFSKVAEAIKNFVSPLKIVVQAMGEAFKMVSPWAESDVFTGIGKTIDSAANGLLYFSSIIRGIAERSSGKFVNMFRGLFRIFFNLANIGKAFLDPLRRSFDYFFRILGVEGVSVLDVLASAFDWIADRLVLTSNRAGQLSSIIWSLMSVFKLLTTVLGGLFKIFKPILNLFGVFTDITMDSMVGATGSIAEFAEALSEALTRSQVFDKIADKVQRFADFIEKPLNTIRDLINEIFWWIRDFGYEIGEAYRANGGNLFKAFFTGLDAVRGKKNPFKEMVDWVKLLKKNINDSTGWNWWSFKDAFNFGKNESFWGTDKKGGGIFGGLLEAADEAAWRIASIFTGVYKTITGKDIYDDVQLFWESTVTDIEIRIYQGGRKIQQILRNLIRDTYVSYLEGGKGFGGIAEVMFDGFVGALRGISTLIKRYTGKDITGFVNNTLVPVIQNARNIVVNFIDELTSKYPKFKALNDGLKTFIHNVVEWVRNIKNGKDGWKSIDPSKSVTAFIKGSEKMQKVTGILDKVYLAIVTFAKKAIPVAKNAMAKLSSAFSNSKNYILSKDLPTKFKKAFDTIVKVLKTSATAIKNAYTKVSNAFKTGYKNVKSVVEPVAVFIGSAAKKLADAFAKVKTVITNALSEADFSKPLDVIKSFGKGLAEAVPTIIDTIKEFGEKIIEGFKSLFGRGGADDAESEIEDYAEGVGGVSSTLKNVGDNLNGAMDNISNAFKKVGSNGNAGTVLDKLGTGLKSFADVMRPVVSFFGTLAKKFAPAFQTFMSSMGRAIGSLDVEGVASLLKGGGLFIISITLKKWIDQILGLGKKGKKAQQVPPILDQLTGGFFSSAKSFFKEAKEKLILTTVIAWGAAIGIIANSILVLGSMNAGDALQGTVIVMLIFKQLQKVLDMVKGHDKDVFEFGRFSTRIGIALRIFASAVKTIGSLEIGPALIGTAAVLLFMRALLAILDELRYIAENTDLMDLDKMLTLMDKFEVFALKISAAVAVLGLVVRLIGSMEPGAAMQGIFGVTVIIAEMTAVALALDQFAKDGGKAEVGARAMFMLALGLVAAAGALKILGTMDWAQLATSLSAMGFALALMVGALAVLSMLTFEGAGALFAAGAIAIVATSMLIFASSTYVLAGGLAALTPALALFGSKVDWPTIGKALGLLGGLAVVGLIAAATFYVLAQACLALAVGVAPLGIALLEVAAAVVLFAVGIGLMFTNLSLGILKFVGALEVLDKVKGLDKMLNKFKDTISEFAIAAVKLGLAATVLGIGLAVFGAGFIVFSVGALIFSEALTVFSKGVGILAAAIAALAGGLKLFGDSINYISNLEGLTDGLAKFSKILGALAKTAGVMALLGLGAVVLGAGLVVLGAGLAFTVGPIAILVGAFSKLATALAIISKISPDALGKLRNALTIVIDAIGKFIADFILIVPKLISGVLKGLAESAGQILANLESVVAQFMGPVVEMVMDLIDAVLGALDEHMDSFTEKGSSALQKFMDGMSKKADGLVESAYNMCMSFLEAFDKYIPQFTEKGFDVVISIVDGISDAIDKKAPELRAAIVRLKESIVNGIKTIFGKGDVKEDVYRSIGGGVGGGAREALENDSTDYSTGAVSMKDRVISAIATAFFGADVETKNAEGGKTGGGILESLKEWASGEKFQSATDAMVSAVINALKLSVASKIEQDVPLIGGKIGKLFRKGAEEGADESGKAAKKHVDKANEAVKQGKKTLEESASGYKGAIANGVSKGSGNITGAIDSVVRPAKNKADDYKNNFENVGRHWMEFATKAVNAAGNAKVTPAVTTVSKAAKNKADGFKSNFENVGRHWMQGLTRGIQSEGKKAIAAAKSIANLVKTITANSWQVKSPSRVAKKLGAYWTEGLGNGILSLANYVRNASAKTADGAVDELVGAVAYASDYVSTASTDYKPSITPVLDMTNVRQGAYDISNLLYAAQSAGLANGMSNQFNANSYEQMNAEMRVDNSDVVRAVRGLNNEIEDLKSTVKNLRMVMDTGALVGELRDPMDKALGMKSRHISRGG